MNNRYAWGPTNCKIAFIAEAPGEREMKKDKPLVGPSGQVFDLCLYTAALLNREACYIGNFCKDTVQDTQVLFSK